MHYAHGLAQLDDVARGSVRVATVFPPSRRRTALTFGMHKLLTSFPPAEQERRLDETERQGWRQIELRRALTEAKAAARRLKAQEPDLP